MQRQVLELLQQLSPSALSISVRILHAPRWWQLAKSNIKKNKDLFLVEDIQGEVFFKQKEGLYMK